MSSEFLFKAETSPGRESLASAFEKVATKLEKGEPIGVGAGDDAWLAGDRFMGPTPPDNSSLVITLERDGPSGGPRTKRLSYELIWDESDERDYERPERE